MAKSDAGFLVEYQSGTPRGLESYVGLKLALEACLNRPVDLVEAARLRNPYVLADINRPREVVYAARSTRLALGCTAGGCGNCALTD